MGAPCSARKLETTHVGGSSGKPCRLVHPDALPLGDHVTVGREGAGGTAATRVRAVLAST